MVFFPPVLQNLRKPDQIFPNVIGLLFASCFNEAAQGNKAWFSLEHSPEWGILQWRTNPIFPQVSRPLHRLTRWNSPPKTRYSKMDNTVKSHGLPRKPHHFGEICIDLGRFQANSLSPAVWPALFLKVMGSPDPGQIDGMGGGAQVTSKIAVIAPRKIPPGTWTTPSSRSAWTRRWWRTT